MRKNRKLLPADVRYSIKRLRAEIGESDWTRIETICGLLDSDSAAPLDRVIKSLYPKMKVSDALTRLRQLRSRIRDAANEAGVELALVTDDRTKSDPETRECWFAGADVAEEKATDFGRAETDKRENIDLVPSRVVQATNMHEGKPVVQFFVSYAHANEKEKKQLLELLTVRLKSSKQFSFKLWEDGQILLGEQWEKEIYRAIDQCQFGIFLVSYEFLNSKFIHDHELSRFVPTTPGTPTPGRIAMPVGLCPVDFSGAVDLLGLESRQIFRDKDKKFFSERTTRQTKERFADELFRQILLLVDKHTTHHGKSKRADLLVPEDDCGPIITARAIETHMNRMPTDMGKPTLPSGQEWNAVEYLESWACNREAQPFCALLGEYGMGKTTCCRALSRRLLERRVDDFSVPLPIYLDLRHLGPVAASNPDLSAILSEVIKRSWKGGQLEERLTAQEVVTLVQEKGALAIFDGLDEVLVHLGPAEGKTFTRELWRILPPSITKPADIENARRPGKLLISCRTHFFRTLREERSHFTGEDREPVSSTDYRALVLLPFDQGQIEEYLEKRFPAEEITRIQETIQSVHNLPELASRPYTLGLIARSLPSLEEQRNAGRTVTGVSLYRHMVQSWLERDDGKHTIVPGHKVLLMEYLAAELWRTGESSWSVSDLEQWLIDFFRAHEGYAAHYDGKDRELLKEDLRTATFLVREGEDRFRFAHTSLHEYFLAAYLFRALREARIDGWQLAVPSPETLDFLGQMLTEDAHNTRCLDGLRKIRSSSSAAASRLAVAYIMRAHTQGSPRIPLARFQLAGVDLRGWRFTGTADAKLIMDGIVLRDATLRDTQFEHVSLASADLTGADLSRAYLGSSRLRNTRLERTTLVGTIFRRCDLDGADFENAQLYRTQFISARQLRTDELPADTGGWMIALGASEEVSDLAGSDRRIGLFSGHNDWVLSVAYAPNGQQIAAAGHDGTVRIWDAATGERSQFIVCNLPNREIAVLSADQTRFLGASDGAWRWLGWNAKDPQSGRITRYPAETFGRLPSLTRSTE